MYRSLFPRDVVAEMERLQREMQQAMEFSPTIRGFGRGGFPAINVGGTPQTFEIYAFLPGIDPTSLEINHDRGVLTIAGERKAAEIVAGSTAGKAADARSAPSVHINERFAGRFQRVLTLPDDADPEAIDAKYENGVVHITVKRRSSAQPRRITIQ